MTSRSLFSALTLFVIFLTFSTSNGDCEYYEKCSHLAKCGKISNVGYPFWGDDLKRPLYCGLPDFKLSCSADPDIIHNDDYPIMNIEGDDYQVLSIATNVSSITLKLQYHHPENCNCLFAAINESLNENLFDRSSSSEKTISLVQCHDGYLGDGIHCYDNHGYTYYHSEDLSGTQFCNFIKVTVHRKDLDNLNRNRTLEKVLYKKFEMEIPKDFPKSCLDCQNAGGKCASSQEPPFPFQCYCKDGLRDYPDACPKSGKLKLVLEIAIPVGNFFILIILIVSIFYCKKHKLRSATLMSRTASYDRMRSDLEIGNSFFGIPIFSYTELREATNSFDPNRVLGDGGFGSVYYGKLRDGTEVAVKRLYERYKQEEQFRNEVVILAKLSHPNLVTFYGCTSRQSRELLLVYEYIANGTVADHLYGNRSGSKALTWTIRMKIAVQTAEALSYLHESDIIHRDVKANNILLDNNFMVKVADFGLSRPFPIDATHVSTCPQGTPGYLDPEYDKCYQVTNKSDVYSFGVVLIELISSLPAVDINRDDEDINLSTYAIRKIQHGKLCELVDHGLGFESEFKVKRMVTLVAELAFQCLQQKREIRPPMEDVLEMLKKIESIDYEALEAEEMSRGFEASKTASGVAEYEVEQPLGGAQDPRTSPKSVISSWASRSTVSNTSG